MKRLVAAAFLALVTAATACGGGGSTGGTIGPGPTPITAGFTPSQPSPASLTVSMGTATVQDDLVTIPVDVTGVNGVYAAAFDVGFDPRRVQYVGHEAGALLETGGHTVSYTVNAPSGSSRVVVSASRVGAVPGANAVGTVTLIRLTFRVTAKGSFQLAFENARLLDADANPGAIPGLVDPWPAGTLLGS